MAAITANTGTFDASTSAAWVGGVVPTSVDTVSIPVGSTIIIDAPIVIGATDVAGTLINNSTLTMAGALTIGNASVGAFTFGPGSTTDLNGFHLLLNCAKLRSTATSGSWAVVIGTASNIANGVAGAFPGYNKQDIELSYVSFQVTGTVLFSIGSTLGSQTARFVSDNCVYTGHTSFTVGSTYVARATEMRFKNNSVVNAGIVNFRVISTDSVSTNSDFYGNVLFSTTPSVSFVIYGMQGRPLNDNIIIGYVYSSTFAPQSEHTNNVWLLQSSAASGINTVTGGTEGIPLVKDSVFWSGADNTHFLTTNYVGSMEITGCVFDCAVNGTDNVVVTSTGVNFHHNIALGNAKGLSIAVGGTYGATVIENNTLIGLNGTEGVSALLFAHGQATGNWTVRSNLYSGGECLLIMVNEKYPHVVDYAGYNYAYGTTTKYDAVDLTITSGTATDLVASADPNFVDSTRTFKTYYTHKTTLAWNETDCFLRWSQANGYNPATKCNNGALSGFTRSDYIAWIKEGYAPRLTALTGAGFGGTTIGALSVYSGGGSSVSSDNEASTDGFVLGFRSVMFKSILATIFKPVFSGIAAAFRPANSITYSDFSSGLSGADGAFAYTLAGSQYENGVLVGLQPACDDLAFAGLPGVRGMRTMGQMTNLVPNSVTLNADGSINTGSLPYKQSVAAYGSNGLRPISNSNFVEGYAYSSVTTGLAYTGYWDVKDDGIRYVQLVAPSADFGTFCVNLDLLSGIKTYETAGTSTGFSCGILPLGGGKYRIFATMTALATSTTARVSLNFIKTPTSPRGEMKTGWDGISGVLIYGYALYQSSYPVPYVPPGTTQTSTAHNGTSGIHYAMPQNGPIWNQLSTAKPLTLATRIVMGVGSEELPNSTTLGVFSSRGVDVADLILRVDGTGNPSVSMSYDVTTTINVPGSWSRYEQLVLVMQVNTAGTQFRAGVYRVATKTWSWSSWTAYDGSFNPSATYQKLMIAFGNNYPMWHIRHWLADYQATEADITSAMGVE